MQHEFERLGEKMAAFMAEESRKAKASFDEMKAAIASLADQVSELRKEVDGNKIAAAFVDKTGELLLTLESSAIIKCGHVRGEDGKDGRDGIDGKSFTFDDLTPEQRELLKGEKGDAGRDGKDGVDGKSLTFDDLTAEQIASLKGKDGRDGIDGKDGKDGLDGKPFTFADLTQEQKESLKGESGKDGIDGKDGRDGVDGKPFTFDDLTAEQRALLKGEKGENGDALTFDDLTAEQRESLKGKDGRDGVDGKDGRDGADGKSLTFADLTAEQIASLKGEPGRDGKDGERGAGVASLLIDSSGVLHAIYSDGEDKALGQVVGQSLADFEMRYLDETHEIEIEASCAGVKKSLRYPAGGMRAKGYWREGVEAQAGDVYACGGNSWVAKTATKARPDYKSGDWIVLAQRGRDGADAPTAIRGA